MDTTPNLTSVLSDPVIWILLAGYFAPTFIAILRKSSSLMDCFLCNLFFGWSGLGWFGAMFFAIIPHTKAQLSHQNKVQRAKDAFCLRAAEKTRDA